MHSNIVSNFLYLLRSEVVKLLLLRRYFLAAPRLISCVSIAEHFMLPCTLVFWSPSYCTVWLPSGLILRFPSHQSIAPGGTSRKDKGTGGKLGLRPLLGYMAAGWGRRLSLCSSFAATWDEVRIGHAQTPEVGNASRSTSLAIASVCLTSKGSEDRKIPCIVLEKTKACLLLCCKQLHSTDASFSF